MSWPYSGRLIQSRKGIYLPASGIMPLTTHAFSFYQCLHTGGHVHMSRQIMWTHHAKPSSRLYMHLCIEFLSTPFARPSLSLFGWGVCLLWGSMCYAIFWALLKALRTCSSSQTIPIHADPQEPRQLPSGEGGSLSHSPMYSSSRSV